MIIGCKHTRAALIAFKRPRATQAIGQPNLTEASGRKIKKTTRTEHFGKGSKKLFARIPQPTMPDLSLKSSKNNNNNNNFIDFVFDMKISVPKNNQYNYK